MHTQYSMEIRLLVCPSCGGPLEASANGGVIDCKFCHAKSELVPRGRLAAFQPLAPPQISEAERMSRLWSQIEKEWFAPPGVAALTEPGPAGVVIPPHRQNEALAAWQRARQRCQSQQALDAAEELLFLTNVFTTQNVLAKNWVRHRAMVESAFEAVFLQRHRTELAADLVCNACRDNDLVAAERWLELVDPHSDDLLADSNYRLAKARLLGKKGDWNGVLAILGQSSGQVPIHPAFLGNLTARRAEAWEKLGRVDAAVNELVAEMSKSPTRRASLALTVQAHGLCPTSFPMAAGQLDAMDAARRAVEAAPRRGGGSPKLVFVLAMLTLLIGVGVALLASLGMR